MPEKGQVIYTDKTFPGFGVRVTAGSKSYVLTYGPDRKRVTIGAVGAVSLKTARERARGILAAPKQELAATRLLEAHTAFLRLHVSTLRPSTAKETERLLNRFAPLHAKPLATLKSRDFMAIVDELADRPTEQRSTLRVIKTLLNWATQREMVPRSALQGVKLVSKVPSRDRVLSAIETTILLRTAPFTGSYGTLLLLLVHTGQRLGQMKRLNPEWIEGDTIRFPTEVMKSGREHTIPLTTTTRSLLEMWTPTDRQNWTKPHEAFLKASGIAHFTRHDLRRTTATGMADLDIAPHVIERILDHQSGSAVSRVYNRSKLMAQMRDAPGQTDRSW